MITKWELTPIARRHMDDNGYTEFDLIGLLGSMLDDANPKGAVEQLDQAYAHGGGWHPFKGFTYDAGTNTLNYAGDPPRRAIADTWLRDEHVILFEGTWVAVIQPDGSYEVARMD